MGGRGRSSGGGGGGAQNANASQQQSSATQQQATVQQQTPATQQTTAPQQNTDWRVPSGPVGKTTQQRMINRLNLVNGFATGTTPGGNTFTIDANVTNINKQFFQLTINGQVMFNRGSIVKVYQVINAN